MGILFSILFAGLFSQFAYSDTVNNCRNYNYRNCGALELFQEKLKSGDLKEFAVMVITAGSVLQLEMRHSGRQIAYPLVFDFSKFPQITGQAGDLKNKLPDTKDSLAGVVSFVFTPFDNLKTSVSSTENFAVGGKITGSVGYDTIEMEITPECSNETLGEDCSRGLTGAQLNGTIQQEGNGPLGQMAKKLGFSGDSIQMTLKDGTLKAYYPRLVTEVNLTLNKEDRTIGGNAGIMFNLHASKGKINMGYISTGKRLIYMGSYQR